MATDEIIMTVARPRSARRKRPLFADGPRHRIPWPWLLVTPLVLLLPPAAASEEDAMLVSTTATVASGGEVDRTRGVRGAVDRFVAWEGGMRQTATAAMGRQDVAEGVRLLADVVQEANGRTLGTASWETLASMRWHGTQLATPPTTEVYGEYADAGHVHSAFMHAAQLLGEFPGIAGEAPTELTRAAGAVDSRPLVAQGAEVRAFFQRSAAALAAASVP